MKGASSTARLIAASIVLQDECGIAARWLPASTIALSRAMLRSGGASGRVLLRALRMSWMRSAAAAIERRLLPGIQTHYLLRKHCIASWAEQAITAGTSQVLILGAGMDGLGAELCRRHTALAVIEMDHPATQPVKRLALEEVLPGAGLRLHAVDLSAAQFNQHLEATGFCRDPPTLIIAEGVLMYLRPGQCLRLLNEISGHIRGPLDVVFSTMEKDPHGRPGFARAHPLIDRWLAWRGEPFRWACSPQRVAKVLERAGLHIHAMHRGDEKPQTGMPDWSPCTGETLYFASRCEQAGVVGHQDADMDAQIAT